MKWSLNDKYLKANSLFVFLFVISLVISCFLQFDLISGSNNLRNINFIIENVNAIPQFERSDHQVSLMERYLHPQAPECSFHSSTASIEMVKSLIASRVFRSDNISANMLHPIEAFLITIQLCRSIFWLLNLYPSVLTYRNLWPDTH